MQKKNECSILITDYITKELCTVYRVFLSIKPIIVLLLTNDALLNLCLFIFDRFKFKLQKGSTFKYLIKSLLLPDIQ